MRRLEIDGLDVAGLREIMASIIRDELRQTPQGVSQDKILTVENVLQLLDISKSSLKRLTDSKKLPKHSLGKRIYFLESEVLASLKKIND